MGTTQTQVPLGGKWQIGAEALLDLYKRVDSAPLGTTKIALAADLKIARSTLDRYLKHRTKLEKLARQQVATRRLAPPAPTTDSAGH
jgi:hypothetical protein